MQHINIYIGINIIEMYLRSRNYHPIIHSIILIQINVPIFFNLFFFLSLSHTERIINYNLQQIDDKGYYNYKFIYFWCIYT